MNESLVFVSYLNRFATKRLVAKNNGSQLASYNQIIFATKRLVANMNLEDELYTLHVILVLPQITLCSETLSITSKWFLVTNLSCVSECCVEQIVKRVIIFLFLSIRYFSLLKQSSAVDNNPPGQGIPSNGRDIFRGDCEWSPLTVIPRGDTQILVGMGIDWAAAKKVAASIIVSCTSFQMINMTAASQFPKWKCKYWS